MGGIMTYTDKPQTVLNSLIALSDEAEKRYAKEQVDGDSISIASTRATFLAYQEAIRILKKCGPLVPAEEVEKAYKEGCIDGFNTTSLTNAYDGWTNSRAKRVMEGME
jgi:hypothetical protein